MSGDPSGDSAGRGAAMQPQATPERPWLGLAHFTEADHAYFYGRGAEVRELTERVRRAPLTVLFGVSGYGKSSIIGAGLIPALRAAGHPIVLLRRCYDDLAVRPLESDVISACLAAIPGATVPAQTPTPTLWEFFHDRGQPWFQLRAPEEDAAETSGDAAFAPWPIVILDQFEEIFIKGEDCSLPDAPAERHIREAARSFLTQLADLVENRPPAALRERLQSDRSEDRRALIKRFDFQARPVRVAVAVRDDFLARLERGRRAMPSLMEHRIELRLLSGPQAFKAVFEPGTKRPGQPPILPADVATAIVRAAAGAAPDVPLEEIDAVPPILSLLCERLNDRRLAASPPPASITAADFSPGEAERILGRFYDDKLRHHPKALREYLEDKLVSDSGFRENVTLDSALAGLRTRVPDVEARLRQLVDDRVLVIEDRGGIPRVEFTHDTLARLALERRAERQARARRLKAIAWTTASLTIAGISLGLTFWALQSQAEAKRQTKNALEQTEIAKANEKVAQEAKVEAQKQAIRASEREKEAETQKTRAEVEQARAEAQKAGALKLVQFMDAQVGEAFVDAVPVQLRERVSARVDAFYTEQGALATFDDHQRMSYHMHKAAVHFAAVKRYETDENYTQAAKDIYIGWERDSASVALHEALRLGEILAGKSTDDRRVTRDLIVIHFDLATLATQLKDADAAAKRLAAARALLDTLVARGPFSGVQCVDWMGLPNLDAAMGDRAADAGDSAGAQSWYEKAVALQIDLVARRPGDDPREKELVRLNSVMGDRAAKNGDKAAAQAWYEKALAVQTRIVARLPNDHDRKTELERIQKLLK